MTNETLRPDSDANDGATGDLNKSRTASSAWLKANAKSYALRWAMVSFAFWLIAWSKGDHILSWTPLILTAIASSCAAVGYYVAHRALNR
jgi:hypothetical protein